MQWFQVQLFWPRHRRHVATEQSAVMVTSLLMSVWCFWAFRVFAQSTKNKNVWPYSLNVKQLYQYFLPANQKLKVHTQTPRLSRCFSIYWGFKPATISPSSGCIRSPAPCVLRICIFDCVKQVPNFLVRTETWFNLCMKTHSQQRTVIWLEKRREIVLQQNVVPFSHKRLLLLLQDVAGSDTGNICICTLMMPF